MARDGQPLDEAARLSEEGRVSDKVRRFEAGGPGAEPLGLPLSTILDRYDFTEDHAKSTGQPEPN